MSGNAGNGVAGPVGFLRPGPRGRLLRGAAGALAVMTVLGLACLQPGGTAAMFTSSVAGQGTLVTGDWTPDPPARCNGKYMAVVYGTMADDVIYGGDHPQIIIGVGGNDTIYAGNSGDCLVGGQGDDRLIGGNGKDIILGGPGNDFLEGGNAKDDLDGEADVDECEGGNGTDVIVNCENATSGPRSATAPLPPGSLELAPLSPPSR